MGVWTGQWELWEEPKAVDLDSISDPGLTSDWTTDFRSLFLLESVHREQSVGPADGFGCTGTFLSLLCTSATGPRTFFSSEFESVCLLSLMKA